MRIAPSAPDPRAIGLIAHADWSVDPKKRWVAVGRPDTKGWVLSAPQLVGAVDGFLDWLLQQADGAAVALGVDLPIGVPRAYAATRVETDFPTFLRRTMEWRGFYQVCASLAEVSPERPFYPTRGIKGMTRASHAMALGLPPIGASLSRACDRATPERPAGAPVFWTLGANQSGKAAAAAWRDMLAPALLAGRPIRLWPFEGPFRALLAPGHIAIAETYPAEAMRHLSIRLTGSKRRQGDRAGVAVALLAAMDRLGVTPTAEMAGTIRDGFGADPAGEDRFDCTLGVLCVLNVLAGHRPDTAPDDRWLTTWEGWVLGQTALPSGNGTVPAPRRLQTQGT